VTPDAPASPHSVLLMVSAYGTRPLGRRRDGAFSREGLSCADGDHSAREVAASSFRSDRLGEFTEHVGDAPLERRLRRGVRCGLHRRDESSSGPPDSDRATTNRPRWPASGVDPTANRSRSSFRPPLPRYSAHRRPRPRVPDACARRTRPRQWRTRSAQVCGRPFPWPSESPRSHTLHTQTATIALGHPGHGIAPRQRTYELERDCQAATR